MSVIPWAEIFLFAGAASAAAAGVFYIAGCDRAVRLLYQTNPEVWERVGRPVGMFWIPRGTRGADFWNLPWRRMDMPDALAKARKETLVPITAAAIDRWTRFQRRALVLFCIGAALVLSALFLFGLRMR